MTLRSMGVEFPVSDDPTKLHGLVDENGQEGWRAECMACGVRGLLHSTPSRARAVAIRHANSAGHQLRVRGAFRETHAPKEPS
jgi:hypothetical protein